MYKIEFLPVAKEDIDNIIYYISHKLKNLTASRKLRDLLINSLDYIVEFPYGNPIYKPPSTLKYEYRSTRVKNFLLFYTINEDKKKLLLSEYYIKKWT